MTSESRSLRLHAKARPAHSLPQIMGDAQVRAPRIAYCLACIRREKRKGFASVIIRSAYPRILQVIVFAALKQAFPSRVHRPSAIPACRYPRNVPPSQPAVALAPLLRGLHAIYLHMEEGLRRGASMHGAQMLMACVRFHWMASMR